MANPRAVAVQATVVAVWIAVPLLLIAVLLFAWGLEPKRTEAFVGRLPYGGDYILKALAKLDSMPSSWSWELGLRHVARSHI
jgi:hypothetical protein